MTNEQLLQKWIDITATYHNVSEGLDANIAEAKEDTAHLTFSQLIWFLHALGKKATQCHPLS